MAIEKIEYHGNMMYKKEIAKLLGVSENTITKYLNKFAGNPNQMELLEKKCEEIREKKTSQLIPYNGEMLTAAEIARRENIKDKRLITRYYNLLGDINEAIKRIKSYKLEYHGEELTLFAIARKENINFHVLKDCLEKTQDIYEAVSQCLASKTAREEKKIPYKGKMKSLLSIAKEEGVNIDTLYKYYTKKYPGNIEKAVFMAKIVRARSKRVHTKKGTLGVSDLAIILGIPERELIKDLNSGMTIAQIKQQKPKKLRKGTANRSQLRLNNGQTLLDYCIEQGLNFRVISYAINTYGKSIEEAVKEYRERGQMIPTQWIFEKYEILLKHLLLNNSINIDRVVYYMRKKNISISDALEEYIIRGKCKNYKLDYEWLHELYNVFTDENMVEEYDDFKREFFVTDQEEECVIECLDQIQMLQRKLLLYEISQEFKDGTFNEKERGDLLRSYNITDEEIEIMFLDLYKEFGNKISLSDIGKRRKEVIADIARRWYYMKEDERAEAIAKENIMDDELSFIKDASNNIVKYQRELHRDIDNKDKTK